MNTKIEFELFITPMSQFHIGTGFGMGTFIDKTTAKNKLGAIYIPGSTIKGKTKYFARQIANSFGYNYCTEDNPCKANPCIVCRIFGSPLQQGKFFFSDATVSQKDIKCVTEESEDNPAISLRYFLNTRTGTKMDRRFGTVQEDHLFTTETGMRGIRLIAKIYGTGNDFRLQDTGKGKLPEELMFLLKSFSLITHLGGAVSRGLGYVRIEWGDVLMNGKKVIESSRNGGKIV
jgi:CRISPR/Cas system CSM-associated protein Csm3 (group 7 of RAMP superfamily)